MPKQPKNPTAEFLKRLMAMDARLASNTEYLKDQYGDGDIDYELSSKEGLDPTAFAKKWKVDRETVMNDIDALRKLKQKVEIVVQFTVPSSGKASGSSGRYYYGLETEPLFAANVPTTELCLEPSLN